MVKRIQQVRDYSAKCREDPARQGTALMLAVLILFVGVFDVVSTNASLAAGNAEANAFIASFQQGWGGWWFVPKLLIHVALALVILWLPSRRMLRHARVGIAIYAVIIASNFHLADWRY
jgi:uncharacterized BrkB/YihY/UPF0761 family membrane protein